MVCKKEKLDKLPDDSTYIFQKTMLDLYLDKPDITFKKKNEVC